MGKNCLQVRFFLLDLDLDLDLAVAGLVTSLPWRNFIHSGVVAEGNRGNYSPFPLNFRQSDNFLPKM